MPAVSLSSTTAVSTASACVHESVPSPSSPSSPSSQLRLPSVLGEIAIGVVVLNVQQPLGGGVGTPVLPFVDRSANSRNSRLVEQLLPVDHVFLDDVHIECDTQAGFLRDFDVAVLDDVLLDEIRPPIEFV